MVQKSLRLRDARADNACQRGLVAKSSRVQERAVTPTLRVAALIFRFASFA